MLRLAKWRSRTKKDAVCYDERIASDETSEGRTGIPETRMFLKEAPAIVGLPSKEKEKEEKREREREREQTSSAAIVSYSPINGLQKRIASKTYRCVDVRRTYK